MQAAAQNLPPPVTPAKDKATLIKNGVFIRQTYATPDPEDPTKVLSDSVAKNQECVKVIIDALNAYSKEFRRKYVDDQNCAISEQERNMLQSPYASALCLLLVSVIQSKSCADECKQELAATGLHDIISHYLPNTLFDHSGLKCKGGQKKALLHSEEEMVNDNGLVRRLFRLVTPTQDQQEERQASTKPILGIGSILSDEDVADRTVSARKLINKWFNDDNEDGNNLCCFEKNIQEQQRGLPKKLSERRILAGSTLMSFFLVAISSLCKTPSNHDLTKDEDPNSYSEKFLATITNARDAVGNGVGDFFTAIYKTFTCAQEAQQRFILNFKLIIIREFVDTIRKKNFTPYRVCKMIDSSLKNNVSSIAEFRKLLNTYIKETDRVISDTVSNMGCRGGNIANRLNLICSNNELLAFRRLLEAVSNHIFGCTKSPDEVGAKICVGKFMQEYLRAIYHCLTPEDFDINGICKFPICVDITNDGSMLAGYIFNIGGLKLFPLQLLDGNVRWKLLHEMSVCVILSLFIAKDDTFNLAKYHFHLYEYFQKSVDIVKDGEFSIITVRIDDQTVVKFKLEYLFSGDMKSHGQAVGKSSLGGASTASCIYCCPDCAKVNGYTPNFQHCSLCVSQNVPQNIPCYHEPYCRMCFEVPQEYQHLQNALTTVKDQFFSVCDIVSNEARSKDQNKKQKTTASGKVSTSPTDVLPDDLNKYCKHDFNLKDMYIAWLDSTWTSGNRVNAEVVVKIATRLSGFQKNFDNKLGLANEYLLKGRRIREVLLFDLEYTNGDHPPVFNSSRYVGIKCASLEELEHHIRVRVCHDQRMFDAYKAKDLNNRLISILEKTYKLQIDESIKTCRDLKKQTYELVVILSLIEKYVLYFMEDHNKKVISESLVIDRLRLIVCTLHMEMRIGLALIESLMNNCIMSKFKTEFANDMLNHVQDYINNHIFHDTDSRNNPTNWHFPRDNKLVGQISLPNPKVVRLISKSGSIIDEIINYRKDEQRKYLDTSDVNPETLKNPENYRTIFSGFASLLTSLKAFNRDNNDDEFGKWQVNEVDPWFRNYLRLFGWDHIGYYVHFLGRGHIYEQLKAFKNIHMHSQQNWEGAIGIIKKYMGRFTQHGGSKGGEKDRPHMVQESLLSSVLRYMLRSCMYVLYPTEEKMMSKIAEIEPLLKENERGLKEVKISPNFRDSMESSISSMLSEEDDDDDEMATAENNQTLAALDGVHLEFFQPVTSASARQ